MARYRFDPGRSRFTVHAFAGGLLSFAAHSPTFAVRDFAGQLRWQPEAPADAGLDVTVRAEALQLTDIVRPADRDEIEGRMRREVLETAAYPEVRFQSEQITTVAAAVPRYRLRIAGRLALHGVTRPLTIEAELMHYSDGARLGGEFPLRMSEFHIRPVTALGGAIKLRDELRLAFDIVAWRQEP
jgi:polyisoprenoid-binding protein YceI